MGGLGQYYPNPSGPWSFSTDRYNLITMAKSRNYVFTLNNYTDEEIENISTLECRYICYGKEVGESLTPHLQGFISFENKKVLPKKLIPRAHFEAMKGTQAQAIAYCEKDGDFTERGDRPKTPQDIGQDEKARWSDIRKLAEAGDFVALAEKYPKESILYDKNLERVYLKRPKDLSPLDHEVVPHHWFYGAPGTGKSLGARNAEPDAYIKNPNNRWWDGYDGQEAVIIDDFDKYQVAQGGDMKRWLDIYSFQAETKGSQTLIRPKRIIVTSNYHPSEIWEDPVTLAAIERRCIVKHFGPLLDPLAPCFKKARVSP